MNLKRLREVSDCSFHYGARLHAAGRDEVFAYKETSHDSQLRLSQAFLDSTTPTLQEG